MGLSKQERKEVTRQQTSNRQACGGETGGRTKREKKRIANFRSKAGLASKKEAERGKRKRCEGQKRNHENTQTQEDCGGRGLRGSAPGEGRRGEGRIGNGTETETTQSLPYSVQGGWGGAILHASQRNG